jgi:hypothetical protein
MVIRHGTGSRRYARGWTWREAVRRDVGMMDGLCGVVVVEKKVQLVSSLSTCLLVAVHTRRIGFWDFVSVLQRSRSRSRSRSCPRSRPHTRFAHAMLPSGPIVLSH